MYTFLGADKNHYKTYEEVKETSDKGRPSLQLKTTNKNTPKSNTKIKDGHSTIHDFAVNLNADNDNGPSIKNSVSMSAQTARAVVTCVECRKPRVIYCKSKLDYRHKVILAKNITSFEYSCGAELFPPNEKQKLAKSMVLRPNLA